MYYVQLNKTFLLDHPFLNKLLLTPSKKICSTLHAIAKYTKYQRIWEKHKYWNM